ncbi:hypothetical protein [Lignipirellula cremea]|uniref:Condensation domain protein n=1 Tax=Lignipirellula cremea TaxID=2528010 RepID=A0A518DL38_9BACT|nr:hypothetical protein [Lignipirellula cremea]QDU92548.1 Condensation domain protein [Lignipirellula cremea]
MSTNALAPPVDIPQAMQNLFPLPLSIIEEFMLADSRPQYPMMADLEMHFQGRIRREPFDAALAQALARAPLFQSVIQTGPKGARHWVRTEQPVPVIWGDENAPLDDAYDAPVDLTAEPGLRVYVRSGETSSSVLLHFHHACSDGMGAFAFIEDFLAAYAQACGDDSVAMRPLEPERLRHRGALGTAGRSAYRGLVDTFIGAREGIRFFLQRPSPLPAIQDPPIAETARLRIRATNGRCSEETTAGLRKAATALNCTVNDLLLRDLFLTMHQWHNQQDGPSTRGQLRILMPQNLRERDDRRMPTGNMLGFAFVTRKRRLCESPQELLRSISHETAAVREGQLSRYFLGGLDALHKAGWLPRVLQGKLCFASAVLTNLGNPLRRFVTRFPRAGSKLKIGDLKLVELTGVPPLRPNTRAVFAVFGSHDKLTLCLRTDPYLYSADDNAQLLNLYLARLDATAAEQAE